VVASRGWGVPSLDEVRCVRKEFVAPGYIGSEIWNDDKSGADRDFGAWQIAPSGTGLYTGTFAGRSYPGDQGYAEPTRPVWVLDARSVAGSVPLSEEEVSTLIATQAPVLRLHPWEQYLRRPGADPRRREAGVALVRNEGSYCSPAFPAELCVAWGGQYFEHCRDVDIRGNPDGRRRAHRE
jgi:hypothetical protein